MACKSTKKRNEKLSGEAGYPVTTERLLFGVDSKMQANDLLQNNINLFEWVKRNKIYPAFWGRQIEGENCLTKEEIAYIHSKACKIAACCLADNEMMTTMQGQIFGAKIALRAQELEIPRGTAIFLEIDENRGITTEYLLGYSTILLEEGYIPGFKVNTDAKYDFDREYSRGMQTDREIFQKCLIWATAPILAEYDRMTTTHLIHPDNWKPYAPSGVKRSEIAVWQYGGGCHLIYDDNEAETTFNIDLVRNKQVIIDHMF